MGKHDKKDKKSKKESSKEWNGPTPEELTDEFYASLNSIQNTLVSQGSILTEIHANTNQRLSHFEAALVQASQREDKLRDEQQKYAKALEDANGAIRELVANNAELKTKVIEYENALRTREEPTGNESVVHAQIALSPMDGIEVVKEFISALKTLAMGGRVSGDAIPSEVRSFINTTIGELTADLEAQIAQNGYVNQDGDVNVQAPVNPAEVTFEDNADPFGEKPDISRQEALGVPSDPYSHVVAQDAYLESEYDQNNGDNL